MTDSIPVPGARKPAKKRLWKTWLALGVPPTLWGIVQLILIGYRSRGEKTPDLLSQAVIPLSVVTGVFLAVVIAIWFLLQIGRAAESALIRKYPEAFIVRVAKESDLLLGLRSLVDIPVDVDALESRVKLLFPLVINNDGIQLWTSDSDPGIVAAIPWNTIGAARMGTISRPGRESRAVLLQVHDSTRSMILPFVVLPQRGSGVSFLGPALDVLEAKFNERGQQHHAG